jgi:hypothetical protein
MRLQTQCGQGRNEASEIKYVTFRLTTEEYTQIENSGCLSAATPFDCVSRRILNDPKMRLGSRILEQKYLRVWKFDPDLPSFNNEIGARLF